MDLEYYLPEATAVTSTWYSRSQPNVNFSHVSLALTLASGTQMATLETAIAPLDIAYCFLMINRSVFEILEIDMNRFLTHETITAKKNPPASCLLQACCIQRGVPYSPIVVRGGSIAT